MTARPTPAFQSASAAGRGAAAASIAKAASTKGRNGMRKCLAKMEMDQGEMKAAGCALFRFLTHHGSFVPVRTCAIHISSNYVWGENLHCGHPSSTTAGDFGGLKPWI